MEPSGTQTCPPATSKLRCRHWHSKPRPSLSVQTRARFSMGFQRARSLDHGVLAVGYGTGAGSDHQNGEVSEEKCRSATSRPAHPRSTSSSRNGLSRSGMHENLAAPCASSVFWRTQSDLTPGVCAKHTVLAGPCHSQTLSRPRTGNSCVIMQPAFGQLHHHPFDLQHWLDGVCLRVHPVKVPCEHSSAQSRRVYKRGLRNERYRYRQSHSFAWLANYF